MVIPFARNLTPQTARNANVLVGCDKNGHSLCCAPWYRRITTIGVARLAIIHFLSATRFMMDLIRGSLYKIVPLTTHQQLLEESEAMLHCVFTYIEYCLAGSTRIFSVRLADYDKRVATAELNMSAGEWRLIQLNGISNREFIYRMNSPSDSLAVALRELVDWYNNHYQEAAKLTISQTKL